MNAVCRWNSLVVLCLVSACSPPQGSDVEGKVLRRGLSGEPATLDPGVAADNFSGALILDLYEGLTAEAANGDVIPAVAESWSVNQSGLEYTFKIRKTARWSNGKPLRAQDFVATWRRDIDPDFASPSAQNLRYIAHASAIIERKEPISKLAVSAPQDDLLVVTLQHPTAFFPHILSHPSTFPVYDPATSNTHDPKHWVSNGPYILASWQPTTGLDLSANRHYWAQDEVSIKRVRYQITTDDAAQYAAYRSGELDLTDTVPANALAAIKQERPSELVVAPFLGTVYYSLNLRNKKFESIDLRQALSMAIDRKRLVDSLGFGQEEAYGLVPPSSANYSSQKWEWSSLTTPQRVLAAREHFAKAGYSRESHLHLKVLINENEVIRRTAILIGAMWKDVLGVDMEIDAEEYKVFLQTRLENNRWDVARLAWTADFNDASNFLEILRSYSTNNEMAYSNTVVDALLDEASNSQNEGQRRTALQQAEQQVLSDYPLIPLYFFKSKRLVKPYLHGVLPNPMNRLPSKSLVIDP